MARLEKEPVPRPGRRSAGGAALARLVRGSRPDAGEICRARVPSLQPRRACRHRRRLTPAVPRGDAFVAVTNAPLRPCGPRSGGPQDDQEVARLHAGARGEGGPLDGARGGGADRRLHLPRLDRADPPPGFYLLALLDERCCPGHRSGEVPSVLRIGLLPPRHRSFERAVPGVHGTALAVKVHEQGAYAPLVGLRDLLELDVVVSVEDAEDVYRVAAGCPDRRSPGTPGWRSPRGWRPEPSSATPPPIIALRGTGGPTIQPALSQTTRHKLPRPPTRPYP